MSKAKKFLIIVFTIMLVISLQFNTSLTHKMNNGFSLMQLMENIFVPEANASIIIDGDIVWCFTVDFTWDVSCQLRWFPVNGCDPLDPDWPGCLY